MPSFGKRMSLVEQALATGRRARCPDCPAIVYLHWHAGEPEPEAAPCPSCGARGEAIVVVRPGAVRPVPSVP